MQAKPKSNETKSKPTETINMSHIPSKAELARDRADKQAAEAKQQTLDDIEFFKAEIVKAMRNDESRYTHRARNVSPEVEEALKQAFGPAGWTLTVANALTGCTIFWE